MRETSKSAFATALEHLLDGSAFTRDEWAALLNVSPAAISQWLNDKTIPRPEILRKIVSTLEDSARVPRDLLIAFYFIAGRPSVEVSPHGARMAPSVQQYMVEPLLDRFLYNLCLLPSGKQERVLSEATRFCLSSLSEKAQEGNDGRWSEEKGFFRLKEGIEATGNDEADDWVEVAGLGRESLNVGGMVVQSAAMRKVLNIMERLGPYKTSVLIYGESGTGKELVARALHTLGPAHEGPFVTFSCSNLVESLAESQLFGHARHAVADARKDSLGYFRSANGGTLFLDEIGELPLRLQPKLLRAVETNEVQPVGSAQSYKVDIRLIAATNRNLRAMVKAGEFRDDLYYRLNASAINIPPLRERRDAVEALTAHYVEHSNRLFGKRIQFISRRALGALKAYDWPGNVRELANTIQSAVMLTDSERLCVGDLPNHLWDGEMVPAERLDDHNMAENRLLASRQNGRAWSSLDDVVNQASKAALKQALHEAGGNYQRAAQLLGISRQTMYRLVARYGMAAPASTRLGNFLKTTGGPL